MHVADRLAESVRRSGSLACVGLDPRLALLPPSLHPAAEELAEAPRAAVAAAFLAFNERILAVVAGHCACVKPQVACYEALGWPGLRCLEATIARANELDIPVIVDAKRGDIGSTATHYREAWLGPAAAAAGPAAGPVGDWLTVNPYLGGDAVAPFLGERPGDGGIFVLVKTSNPGSRDLQDLAVGERRVSEVVADLVTAWGHERRGACGLSDVGAVVGATWPDEAQALRARMPASWFLVPGYGAQGGDAAGALAGRRDDGLGVVVNSSRGIIGAWQSQPEQEWSQAVGEALAAMNADLASV